MSGSDDADHNPLAFFLARRSASIRPYWMLRGGDLTNYSELFRIIPLAERGRILKLFTLMTLMTLPITPQTHRRTAVANTLFDINLCASRHNRSARKAVHFILLLLTAWTVAVQAGAVIVPNGSFESPKTPFADPRMDGWQKAPEPAWYMGGGGFPWDQLVGQFLNTTNGSPTRIDNMDGDQAAYLFALPEVALFQDDNTISGTNSAPTHRFNARFETGKSYALTVGLLGGGGGMTNAATFQISLYYRDTASNMVTVAATIITNTQALFPTTTRFADFQVRTPFVRAGDAWSGKNVGIRLASTVSFDRQGGYWDLDNVRLTETVVPNGSFESPETSFADPRVAGWQKAPEPAWYMGGGGFPWDQLVGQFLNTTNGSPTHIDNMDGEQAAYLFALPEVAIFQDDNTLSGIDAAPTHDFNVKFELGKSYALTAGVLGGGGGMPSGATFEISLYYRDTGGNRVTVAATSITNTATLFPTNTRLTDFKVIVAPVKAGDAWVGKNIGIQLAPTVGFDRQGGYWDVDNVRLEVLPPPVLTGLGIVNSQFRFTLESAPGRFEILTSTHVGLPLSSWTSLGMVVNLTGSVSFTDTDSGVATRFYQTRQVP